jgi:hypothetical protein
MTDNTPVNQGHNRAQSANAAPLPSKAQAGVSNGKPNLASTETSPANVAGHGSRLAASKPAAISHPDGRTMGQGPATFEEMGIPQGKNDDDCVSTIPDGQPRTMCSYDISQVVM